jgi:hypothetical protein
MLLLFVGLVSCSVTTHHSPSRLYPFSGAVYYTDREQQTVDHDLEQATAACMKARGLQYKPPASDTSSDSTHEPDNPYFLLDRESARIDGYGIVSAALRSRQSIPGHESRDSGSRYYKELVGDQGSQKVISLPDGSQLTVAVDGCTAKAREAVFGSDWDRLYYTVQALSNIVIERTEKDPAVVDAVRVWSSCMHRSGYKVKSLAEPREQVSDRGRNARSTASKQAVVRVELMTAEADAACQETADLRAAVQRVQHRNERQVLTTQYRHDLDQLRQRLQAVFKR